MSSFYYWGGVTYCLLSLSHVIPLLCDLLRDFGYLHVLEITGRFALAHEPQKGRHRPLHQTIIDDEASGLAGKSGQRSTSIVRFLDLEGGILLEP